MRATLRSRLARSRPFTRKRSCSPAPNSIASFGTQSATPTTPKSPACEFPKTGRTKVFQRSAGTGEAASRLRAALAGLGEAAGGFADCARAMPSRVLLDRQTMREFKCDGQPRQHEHFAEHADTGRKPQTAAFVGNRHVDHEIGELRKA